MLKFDRTKFQDLHGEGILFTAKVGDFAMTFRVTDEALTDLSARERLKLVGGEMFIAFRSLIELAAQRAYEDPKRRGQKPILITREDLGL